MEEVMEISSTFSIISEEIDKVFQESDLDLFHEFLAIDEPEMAIEFICDRISEYDFRITDRLGQALQIASAKLCVPPGRSWWGIVVKEAGSGQLKRLYSDGPDLVSQARGVFEKAKKYIPSRDAEQIDEYLSHDELELAMEDLCYVLVHEKIEISKQDLDRLRTIWLDMGLDPAQLSGFSLRNEEPQ
jgi:hypothetical protein